jgi:hypothetical protein
MRTTIVLVVLLTAAAGCAETDSNGDSDPNTANPPAATTETPPAEPTPEALGPPTEPTTGPTEAGEQPYNECLPVPEELFTTIIVDGQEEGTGLAPVAGAAIRVPDYSEVYFIAVEFSATGVDNSIGVWASNSLEPGGGIIMAVDPFAQEFTVWPDADTTAAEIDPAHPYIAEAKSCLGNA